MKKIYYIMSHYSFKGPTPGAFFKSKEEAQEFCHLINYANYCDFYDCTHCKYEDYFVCSKDVSNYKDEKINKLCNKSLIVIIKKLKECIAKITHEKHKFVVGFDDDEYEELYSFKDMENLFKNASLDYEWINPSTISTGDECRELTKDDLPTIKEVYDNAKKQIENLKHCLAKYIQEYKEKYVNVEYTTNTEEQQEF